MKKQKKVSRYNRILMYSIIIATIISLCFAYFFDTIFNLNENQLLYLFSTMAQVTGGLFGLTLTAYVFFVDKFKETTRGEDILYDATISILDTYFRNLILIGATSGIVIFLCIFGIIDMHNWKGIYALVINEGVTLFVVLVTEILIFGIMLLDPNKLDKEVKRLKKEAERYYKSNSTEEGDFREFLKTYNLLERLIINFAESCTSENRNFSYNYKPQIIQSMRVLLKSEIINYNLAKEIDGLRMYRNALVHGIDFSIVKEVCDRILEIYEALHSAFNVYQEKGRESKEWQEAMEKVYNLSKNEKV